jgi:hypothetical protein
MSKDANGNDNCLHEKQCPECGQSERIDIAALTIAHVLDDGTDHHTDMEYDSGSYAYCPKCHYEGNLLDFEKAYEKKHKKGL